LVSSWHFQIRVHVKCTWWTERLGWDDLDAPVLLDFMLGEALDIVNWVVELLLGGSENRHGIDKI